MAYLAYIGRALALYPAKLGELFEEHCTVEKVVSEEVWKTSRSTGRRYRKVERIGKKVEMYWYAEDDGKEVFCAYSGYGAHIEKTLKQRKIPYTTENRVDHGLPKPNLEAIRHIEWRPRQKEVVAAILAYNGGAIDCPTAFGKTFIVKQIAKVYPESPIIVTVPSVDIANDIYDGLRFDIPGVGMVGDGKNKPDRVTVAVSQSLHKCDRHASLVLVDECHAILTTNFIKKLHRFYRAKFFGFTASPEGRSDKADRFLEALFGEVLVRVSYQECVESGNVAPIKVHAYTVEDGPDVSAIENHTKADRLGIWTNRTRNEFIARVVRKVEKDVGDNEQILIMVDKTEHAYALGQYLDDYTVVSAEPDPRRVAQMRRNGSMLRAQKICTKKSRGYYKRMFELGRLKKVIATKVWKQGVDFQDLSVLVRADAVSTPIQSTQIPGRLSRLGREKEKDYGILIDFFDKFSGNLYARSLNRFKVYRSKGWSIENKTC